MGRPTRAPPGRRRRDRDHVARHRADGEPKNWATPFRRDDLSQVVDGLRARALRRRESAEHLDAVVARIDDDDAAGPVHRHAHESR